MKPFKPVFTSNFNESIRIEADTENHTTSDAGAILIRSILNKTKILDVLIPGIRIGPHILWPVPDVGAGMGSDDIQSGLR